MATWFNNNRRSKENKFSGELTPADLIFKTKDHPEANNRIPLKTDHAWNFQVPLEDGKVLRLCLGEESMILLRSMFEQMTIDDKFDKFIADSL